MRILLAEDHSIVRAGIHALLEKLENVTEVVEAADGEEAVAAATAYRPDVVLMDLSMPRMNGFDATARILKESPAALKAGTVAELQKALDAAEQGQTYVSPDVREAFAAGKKSAELSPIERLTPRQREVLKLVAEGLSNRQIGQALNIHPKTVDSHRTQLMETLDIHDVAELVRFAIRNGLVMGQ